MFMAFTQRAKFALTRILRAPQLTPTLFSRYFAALWPGQKLKLFSLWRNCRIRARRRVPDLSPMKMFIGSSILIRRQTSFASHQAREKKTGKKRPRSVPPCAYGPRPSLWLNRDSAYEALPKLRGQFKLLASVKITKQCGVSILKRSHISFWRYATFKPSVNDYESL
jgi:hypothetical protein